MDQSPTTAPTQNSSSPSRPSRSKSNFWKIGFFVEALFILLLAGLFVVMQNYYKREKIKPDIENKVEEKKEGETIDKKEDVYPLIEVKSWEQFSDPNYPFSFQYPSGWIVNKSCLPGGEECFVSITNYPDACRECKDEERVGYCYLALESLGKNKYSNQYMDALEYLLTDWLVWHREEKERMETGGLPTVPGFTRTYKANADYLFNPSAVEVNSFADVGRAYLLITKSRNVYHIDLKGPRYRGDEEFMLEDYSDDPLIIVLKSLQIEGSSIIRD